MDRRTTKLTTMYNRLHPWADVFGLYIPRKEDGRGLANIQDSVNMKQQNLSRYVDTSDEELLKSTKEENVRIDWNGEADTEHKHRLYDRSSKISGRRNRFTDSSWDGREKLLTQRAGSGWHQVAWRRKRKDF